MNHVNPSSLAPAPSGPTKTPFSCRPPSAPSCRPLAPLTHGVTPAVTPAPKLANRPLSYIEQLRQASAAQAAPYVELLRATKAHDDVEPALPTDRPLREALIQILASVLSTGRDRISGRDIFWRLRIPPQLELQKGRDIARVLRSLGWVRCHYGKNGPGLRIWGWKWREWSISAAIALDFPEDTPLPVFRRHRAPISIFYGDDVPVHEATPEGIWAIIRYPIGPRLKIGTPRPPAKTHRWGNPPPAGNTAAD